MSPENSGHNTAVCSNVGDNLFLEYHIPSLNRGRRNEFLVSDGPL